MDLSELKIGDSAKLIEVKGEGSERQHLLDMGLIPGTIVKLVKRAPMGDPLEILLHGYNLAIRISHAKNLIVKKTNSDFYNLSCDANCSKCTKDCSKRSALAQDTLERLYSYSKQIKKDELINQTEHPGLGEPGRFHNKNSENPLPENKTITFALAGNPNSGKTTLFNALTGTNQHVGNFPGVTIDRKDGVIKGYQNTRITDLPGAYSLSPYSKEELVARDFILKDDVDCIINIVDATCLERSLYLTMQLMQLEHPMVVALNMMDELASNNGTILVNKLEELLGVPIVPISAVKKEGISELINHAIHIAKYQELPIRQDFCDNDDRGGAVHQSLHSIMHTIEDHCAANIGSHHQHKIPIRFAAEKIAENDKLVFDELNLSDEDKIAIEQLLLHMEKKCKLDRCALIADMRYRYIIKLCNACLTKAMTSIQRDKSNVVDKILTGKITGIASFILIMAMVFWLTFDVIGHNLQNLIATGISAFSNVCQQLLEDMDVGNIVQSFVIDGVFAGVGTLISFLPIIVVMFLFLSLLEDSGYMARIAFVMDKILRKIGLSGRSIVPMLIGFGCSVPAIMSTRTLPSERDRKLTILLIPFMSCSAKLPVYAFISTIFFPGLELIVMLCLYLLGILIGIVVALILKGKSRPVPFIMELPPYRFPSAKNVVFLLRDKCSDFLKRAFTIILVATIIIWFLQSFNFNMVYVFDSQESILSSISTWILPIFKPLGIFDWRLVTSLVSGFIMKESVVATIGVLFSSPAELLSVISPAVAVSFLVFCLLYTPCVAAISSVKRELGIKWAVFIVVFQCVIAWLCAFLTYSIFFNFLV